MGKEITRRISVYINGKEVKKNLSSVGAAVGKLRGQIKHLTPGTEKFIKKSADLRKVRRRYRLLNDEIKGTNSILSKIKKSAGAVGFPVAGAILFTDALKAGLRVAKEFVLESINIAEEARGIEKTFNEITNSSEILERARAASRGLISDLDIKIAANKFKNFNLDLEKLPTILEFVSVRAAQTGDKFENLFDSAIEGLAKESKLRIDNLGISVVDLNNELDATPNFLTAVSNIAEKEISKAGTLLDEAENATQKWNTSLANAQLRIGKLIRKTGVVPFFQKLGSAILDTIGAQKNQQNATQKQRLELNLLVSKIIETNEGTVDRKKLIEELTTKYPFYLKFLKDEKTDNDSLKTALGLVNDMYVKKLALTRVQTKLDSTQQKQAVNEDKLAQNRLAFRQNLVKTNQLFYKGNTDNLKNSLENTSTAIKAALEKDIKILNSYGSKITAKDQRRLNRRIIFLDKIREQEKTIIGSKFIKDLSAQAVDEVKKEIKLLEKELGITTEDANNAFENNEVDLGTVGKKKLTPKDKEILASRKRLAEFINQFNDEQELLEELKQSELKDKEEAEELLRLEAKYLKMAEDAGYETILAAGLKEAHETEISNIEKKHQDKRIKLKLASDKKYQLADAATKKKLIAAETKLENAKRALRATGINGLKNMLGQHTAAYKFLFGLEKALAINTILVDSSKAVAQITANTGVANLKAIAANPFTAGQPFVTSNTILGTKAALTTKIQAATQIASIVGSSLKGFYFGGHTGSDGKNSDQYGKITGYTHETEYVAPAIITQDPYYAPTINKLENARQEKLGISDGQNSESSEDQSSALLTSAVYMLLDRLEEPIEAFANIGDDKISQIDKRTHKLNNSRKNAKIT